MDTATNYVYRIAGRGLSSKPMTFEDATAGAIAKAAEAGKTVHVERRLPSGAGMEIVRTFRAPIVHDTPCVCGAYDRCSGVRAEDARRAPTHNAAIRARNRAYND